MKVRFLTLARNDLRFAAHYYNGQRRGLGAEFRDTVRLALERIKRHPAAWHPLSANTRRFVLHRFPYGIIYQVRDDEILIVAVAHLHREPDHWRDRLDPT